MTTSSQTADQYECTRIVLDVTPNAAIVSNLGVASYVLIDIEDRDRNFYMNGAMGVTTPLGIGLASAIDDQVTVLEGDGSLLMSLGTLATMADQNPSNLTVVVWNNETFQTTGGQRSLSPQLDFSKIAKHCDIASWNATTNEEFKRAYKASVDHDGSALVACSVEPITPTDHPRLDYGHSYIKYRFRTAISSKRAP